MRTFKLVWTPRAKQRLEEIRRHIALDAPRTAVSFVRRLKRAAGRLRLFPESGSPLGKRGDADLREIYYGDYSIIYDFDGKDVTILTVRHGAQMFD
jgi:plasmid stabilization system protein ParE